MLLDQEESFISNKWSQLAAVVKGTGVDIQAFLPCWELPKKKKSGNDLSENLEHSGSGNNLFPWLAHGRE